MGLQHHRNAFGCQKLCYRKCCMGWRIVVMKGLVFCNFETNPHDPLSWPFKNFCVVILIDCLSSRNNTHGIKEAHKHAFHFWVEHTCLLWPWYPFERHSKLWHLVSASYWKNQLSSPMITWSINSGSASTCSSRSAQIFNCESCCCSVRFLGTILAQIFLIPNSSVSIKQTVATFMLTLSAIIWTVNLRSDPTGSLTHAVLSPVCAVDGCLLHCPSSARFLPSENILCQRKTCALDVASSPKACWSFPCVVVALAPNLTQKRDTAEQCSMLPFPQ